MAVRRITSDPKPSQRLQGWHYAYYSKQTAAGGECTVVFPPSIADLVKKGFAFDDGLVVYDESLKASVLTLDFDVDQTEPQDLPEPSLPADLESGWGDPDGLPASPPTVQPGPSSVIVQSGGVRPQALRRRAASQLDPDLSKVPAPLLKMGVEISRLFLVVDSLLKPAVNDSSRALIAQKLAVSAAIPYYRSVGVTLSEEEAQSLMNV
jgi:hypothetical protein